MKYAPGMNTATGRTNSKITVGKLPDPFFDMGKSEALALADIIDLMAETDNEVVTVIIDKSFLKHIVHSHLLYLRKLQK